ncbi:peptidase M19 [Novosphingobium sediminis]|uniref:Peptidase M19 n=1 Tax=Novosphingobium sediminis TaxID=707214 RepID=A0A512AEU6_9SPHN|nr:dipeptidase [Novosphingobium sediminis]GEN98218.1 peptidase M19 [Novosphingobium sediminis]
MHTRSILLAASAALALLAAGPANAAPKKAPADPATALQQRLLTLDTHLDTPASLALPGWSIMDAHTVAQDYTQVDLPRMKRGGLDGGFWAIYTPQGPLTPDATRKARDFAFLRAAAIREMVAAHPESFALASKAADAAAIKASGKRVVYLSIENAWPLGDDPTLLRSFYAMGVRISGFAHFRTNQFADSSTDKAKWDGLSPLGVQLLAEMNRLGVVPDLSHSSDRALDDALRLSKAPLVLTHSGCKAVFDHPRNIDDAHLKALAEAGGVIQINSVYVKGLKQRTERDAAMKALEEKYPEDRTLTADERDAMLAERHAIDTKYPEVRATFDDVMANLLHALKVAGVDHVGIGLDWDGGGGVTGLEDIADLPRITKALLAAGYTEADVAKIWSGNVLRVLAAAEAEAAKEQAGS